MSDEYNAQCRALRRHIKRCLRLSRSITPGMSRTDIRRAIQSEFAEVAGF